MRPVMGWLLQLLGGMDLGTTRQVNQVQTTLTDLKKK